MAEIKWIKLDISIFDNRKIKQIKSLPDGDSIILIWLQLMCLAGNVNDCGKVYLTEEIPYTEQMLSTAFNEPLATVQMALKVFEQFRMIDVIDDIIYISNWEKYQSVEGMEKVREQNRIRKRNQREREKLLENKMSRDSNVTVTQSHATDIDIEEDKEKEIKKDIRKKPKGFTPPTLEDVERYCLEKGLTIEPKAFIDYFTESNWIDSKGNKVRNWKQKLLTWQKYEPKQKEEKVFQSTGSTIEKKEVDPEIWRMLREYGTIDD